MVELLSVEDALSQKFVSNRCFSAHLSLYSSNIEEDIVTQTPPRCICLCHSRQLLLPSQLRLQKDEAAVNCSIWGVHGFMTIKMLCAGTQRMAYQTGVPMPLHIIRTAHDASCYRTTSINYSKVGNEREFRNKRQHNELPVYTHHQEEIEHAGYHGNS